MQDLDSLIQKIKTGRQKQTNGNALCGVKLYGEVRQCKHCNPDCKVVDNTYMQQMSKNGVGKRFIWISLHEIKEKGIPEQTKDAYIQISKYCLGITDNIKAGKGLMLIGTVGTMKTTLAIAVMRHCVEHNKHCMYVSMPSLIDNLESMRNLDKVEAAKYEDKLRNTPLLLLDDFGAEKCNVQWILSKVESIINSRYDKMLPIIATSNLTIKQMKDIYTERMIDRMCQTMQVIILTGDSLRK